MHEITPKDKIKPLKNAHSTINNEIISLENQIEKDMISRLLYMK